MVGTRHRGVALMARTQHRRVALMARTRHREVAPTHHRNVTGFLAIKIYIMMIVVLIRMHVPTMGATARASPTMSSTLPTLRAKNMIWSPHKGW